MARKAPGRLHRQIIEAAAARGVSVTSRQLARWRERGLTPAPVQRGCGRGAGSTSAYPRETVDYIVEFARRVRTGTPLYETVLWVFRDDSSFVPEPCVRQAFRLAVAAVSDFIEGLTPSTDPLDQADAIAALANRSKTGATARRNRAAADLTFNDLDSSGYWDDIDPHDGNPTRRAFRHDLAFNTAVAVLNPDSANLDDLASVELLHGRTSTLETAPDGFDSEAMREVFSQLSLPRLQDAASTCSIDSLRTIASTLRAEIDTDQQPEEHVCPSIEVLLLPLLISVALGDLTIT